MPPARRPCVPSGPPGPPRRHRPAVPVQGAAAIGGATAPKERVILTPVACHLSPFTCPRLHGDSAVPLFTFSLFHLITSGAAPRPRGSVQRPRKQRLRPQRPLPPAPGPAPDVPVRFGAPLRHGLRWSPGDVPVYGSPLFTLSHYHLITVRGSRRTPHVHVPNCALLIVNCEFSPKARRSPGTPTGPRCPPPRR